MNIRYFQQITQQFRDAMGRDVGVILDNGTIVSSSNVQIPENDLECVLNFANDNLDTFAYNGYTYRSVQDMGKVDFIAFVRGDDALARSYAEILKINFTSVKALYDDKYNHINFIKNFLLDNILPGDVLAKAAELHLPIEAKRAVFLIRAENSGDFSVLEILENMFPNKQTDYVVSIDETDIALVREFTNDVSLKEMQAMATEIIDTITAEALVKKVTVGIGTIISNIKEIATSFKEAQVALEVGKVFDDEKNIISYEDLGIGRLIYQLPTTLCQLFLSEVFKKGSINELDGEIIETIKKFFENNLNVSETSRQLYVHRNTLVYRLDKIQKITGLDLRIFDQAIIFKVAMMVNKYLKTTSLKI